MLSIMSTHMYVSWGGGVTVLTCLTGCEHQSQCEFLHNDSGAGVEVNGGHQKEEERRDQPISDVRMYMSPSSSSISSSCRPSCRNSEYETEVMFSPTTSEDVFSRESPDPLSACYSVQSSPFLSQSDSHCTSLDRR